MYYLQSRYYNAEWGRFINADGLIGQTGELLAHNLFMYCKNNPVLLKDENGFRPAISATSRETQEEVTASLAAMYTVQRTATKTVANVSSPVVAQKNSSSFSYIKSALKAGASGLGDSAGEKVGGKLIREKLIYKESGVLTIGQYTSNLSKYTKWGKKALGIGGTIISTGWDVGNDLINGEVYSAKVDLIASGVGFGAGLLIGFLGGLAVAAGAPALVIGIATYGVSLGISVAIDKYATDKKNKYYGR